MAIDKMKFKWAKEDLDPTESWDAHELDRYREAARRVLEYIESDFEVQISLVEQFAKSEFMQAEGARELANEEIMKRYDAEAMLKKFSNIMIDASSSDIPPQFFELLGEIQDYFN